VTVLRIVLSLALPLAFGLAPWPLAVVSTRAAAGALGAGLALAAVGSIVGGAPWAVSDLVVAVAAVGGGVALGRVLSLKPRVMAIFLASCSIADIAQNALIGGGAGAPAGSGAAPAWQAYAVLRIAVPGGHYDIGPLDLLLFTAVGEHWRRRRGSRAHSAGPGVAGMALADLIPFHGSLPLIPFVFAGWLATEGASRRSRARLAADAGQRRRRRAPPDG